MKETDTKYVIRLNRKNEFSWAQAELLAFAILTILFTATMVRNTLQVMIVIFICIIVVLTALLHQGLEVIELK